jgi:ferritin-like metal-binding protein YciE
MKLESMHDLLVTELKDLYSAENQLVKALPRIAKKTSSAELREALAEHLEQTRNQVERLDEIFEELEESPRGKKCEGMEGLIEEGKEILEADGEDAVRDAALIAACQRVEHYEIASYGCARTFANQLGLKNVVRLLDETLQEEKEADQKLTEIAESQVNTEAHAPAGSR